MAVRLASCVLLSMLLGCAQLPPGAERGQGRVDRNGYYVVKSGDTLGRIALRYGFDYRELASINGKDTRLERAKLRRQLRDR